MTILQNYSWIRKINSILLNEDIIPLFRAKEKFDFEKFSLAIKKIFEAESFSLSSEKALSWQTPEQINADLEENDSVSIISPFLDGKIYWIMKKNEALALSSFLLNHKKEKNSSSMILEEGFYHFALLKALEQLNQLSDYKNLALKLNDFDDPPDKNSLVLNLKIEINDHIFSGKIALSSLFRSSWENHFFDNPPTKAADIAKTLEIRINFEVALASLSIDEFKSIRPGDFVILDHVYFYPEKKLSKIKISAFATPLFWATLEEDKIKLIDFITLYEEEETMKKNSTEKQNAPEDLKTILSDMPINVVVEIASYKITLEKLMQLQPGNLLDLNVSPEKEVLLSINGQKIGKGELLSLGETLGVRITELG